MRRAACPLAGLSHAWTACHLLLLLCGALKRPSTSTKNQREGKITNIEDWVQKSLDTLGLPFPSLHLVRGCESEFRICAAQGGQAQQ